MFGVDQIIQRVDWEKVREWLSPIIAAISVWWAIRESRAKRRESAARADDAKRYTQALETVIRYGNFVQHLEGVDRKVATVADQLTTIAEKTVSIAQLAERQTNDALKSFSKTAQAATQLSEQLLVIGRTALRAQRDSVRAHTALVKEIETPVAPQSDTIHMSKERRETNDSLRAMLLTSLRRLEAQTDTIRVRRLIMEMKQAYSEEQVLSELQAMHAEGVVRLSAPVGKSSVVDLL